MITLPPPLGGDGKADRHAFTVTESKPLHVLRNTERALAKFTSQEIVVANPEIGAEFKAWGLTWNNRLPPGTVLKLPSHGVPAGMAANKGGLDPSPSPQRHSIARLPALAASEISGLMELAAHSDWTYQQLALYFQSLQVHGPEWDAISMSVNGAKSPNQIKTFYTAWHRSHPPMKAWLRNFRVGQGGDGAGAVAGSDTLLAAELAEQTRFRSVVTAQPDEATSEQMSGPDDACPMLRPKRKIRAPDVFDPDGSTSHGSDPESQKKSRVERIASAGAVEAAVSALTTEHVLTEMTPTSEDAFSIATGLMAERLKPHNPADAPSAPEHQTVRVMINRRIDDIVKTHPAFLGLSRADVTKANKNVLTELKANQLSWRDPLPAGIVLTVPQPQPTPKPIIAPSVVRWPTNASSKGKRNGKHGSDGRGSVVSHMPSTYTLEKDSTMQRLWQTLPLFKVFSLKRVKEANRHVRLMLQSSGGDWRSPIPVGTVLSVPRSIHLEEEILLHTLHKNRLSRLNVSLDALKMANRHIIERNRTIGRNWDWRYPIPAGTTINLPQDAATSAGHRRYTGKGPLTAKSEATIDERLWESDSQEEESESRNTAVHPVWASTYTPDSPHTPTTSVLVDLAAGGGNANGRIYESKFIELQDLLARDGSTHAAQNVATWPVIRLGELFKIDYEAKLLDHGHNRYS